MFARLTSFLRSAFRRSRFETDLDAELRAHMHTYADDLISRGVPRGEAEIRARREFGGVQSIKDECRESKGLNWPDALARDFRFAFRVLRKSPAFALTAIATLALCIGANTAIFSVVDAVLFRPLPYPQPDRLAMVSRLARGANGESEEPSVDGRTWEYLRDHVRTMDLAVYSGSSTGVNFATSASSARYVQQQRVSAGFFRVLGVAPLMGQEIQPDQDKVGGPAVAVLSYPLWSGVFRSDPPIVGRKIDLRGEPYTVIGVMPKGFESTPPAEIWTPLRPSRQGEGGGSNYELIARVRPGFERQDAEAEIGSLGASYFASLPSRPGESLRLHLIPLKSGLAFATRTPLLLLWAAVGVVLLIGCVNIASLMLARSGARRHEIATRLALGSGRGAILRQLLTESLLIGLVGGLGGLALGYAILAVLRSPLAAALGSAFPLGTGAVPALAIDGRVLAATAAIALLTVFLSGLYPGFEATRLEIRSSLAASGRAASRRHRDWSRSALVLCEVALGMVLLVGAGLVLRTLLYLTNLDPGYDGRGVLTASLSLQDARYTTAGAVNRLYNESLERIREYPGIEAAGIGLTLPYQRALNNGARVVDGAHPMTQNQITNMTYVTPGYFEALRFRMLRGRTFQSRDRADTQPVAIVNEAYIRRYIRDSDPLGEHVAIAGAGPAREIVGIVADVQERRPGWGNFGPIGPIPDIFIPASQLTGDAFRLLHTWFSPSWVVRTGGRQADIAQAMRAAVASVDPQLPFAEFHSMDEIRESAFSLQRLETALLGALAGLALALAAIGIYGLIAHSVIERTREFGIRLALGSSRWRAIRSAAQPGIVLAAVGVAIGVVLSRAAGSTIRSLIWGVKPADEVTFIAVACVLLGVAALAALIPALRIARIDPATTLREE